MSQDIDELTYRAIPKLISADAEKESIVVQVYDIISAKSGRLTSLVSDGTFFIKAFFNDDKIIKPGSITLI